MMKLLPINLRLPVGNLQRSIHSGSRYFQKPFGSGVVQRSSLKHGIKVAAAHPLGKQIGACTVMFQAGSRVEKDNQLGASHFIRAMSGSSGCAYSGYGKMRQLHQRGSYLSCSGDRQSIAFTLRCPVDDFCEMKNYLLDTAVRCCYLDHEVTDIKSFIKDNLVRMHPIQRLLDLVQRAVWAGPLGNSIFCDEERIDNMSSVYLKDFVSNFVPDNCTIGSYGLAFEETMKLAEALRMEYNDKKTCIPQPVCSFPRRNSEYYDLGRGSDTYIAVAVPGTGAYDMCSIYKHALIAAACELDFMQLERQTLDGVAKTPLCCSADKLYTEYKAFNISYLETGVFGVMAKTRSCTAENTARQLVSFLTNISKLTTGHVAYAKKRLKLDLAHYEEDCVRVSESLALQIANNLVIDSPEHSSFIIDSITNEDVLKTAKDISSKQSKMSIAVVGDIAAVPSEVDLIKHA